MKNAKAIPPHLISRLRGLPRPKRVETVWAVAESMVYEHRLNELGKEFEVRELAPLIVKGQAIVDLAFPRDEIRLSDDVDLLVGDDCEGVVTALRELGYQEQTKNARPRSGLGDRVFVHSGTRLPKYVEVHRCLDKFLIRPIPYSEILARAIPSGKSGFCYPTIEDLFLLVVLHASADNSFDPERVERDLWFLVNHGKPNMDVVWSRARKWELTRALFRLSNGRYPKKPIQPRGPVAYLFTASLWHDNPITVVRGLSGLTYACFLDHIFPSPMLPANFSPRLKRRE